MGAGLRELPIPPKKPRSSQFLRDCEIWKTTQDRSFAAEEAKTGKTTSARLDGRV